MLVGLDVITAFVSITAFVPITAIVPVTVGVNVIFTDVFCLIDVGIKDFDGSFDPPAMTKRKRTPSSPHHHIMNV